MGEIKDLLLKTYLKTGARPAGAPQDDTHDAAMGKAPAKLETSEPRTVGNIAIAMQAQKLFNPNLPPAPSMKTPPAKMQDTGTAPAMDMDQSFLGRKQ